MTDMTEAKRLLLAAALACLSTASSAAILTADFRTESDLPSFGSGNPLVYEHLGATVGVGAELDDSHLLTNPDNWIGGVVHVDLDPATSILTLSSQDSWDFQTFTATLKHITGATVTGIFLLTNNLTTPNVAPTLSFTADSVTVSYDYVPDVFNFSNRTATFQLSTSTAVVPEPSSIALVLSGVGIAGFAATRRRAVS
jgi:hypothetical protein